MCIRVLKIYEKKTSHYKDVPVRPVEVYGCLEVSSSSSVVVVVVVVVLKLTLSPGLLFNLLCLHILGTTILPQLAHVFHYTMLSPKFSSPHCPSFLDSETHYSAVYFFITYYL